MTSRLMDPKDKDGYPFEWVPSIKTDIRKTFAKARCEILESKKPPRPVSVLTERKKQA